MLNGLVLLFSSLGLKAFLDTSIGPYLQQRTKDRFASEGDDVTGPWAALQAATVNIRESQQFGGAHPINVRTGELEDWVTEQNWITTPHALGATMHYPKSKPTGVLGDKLKTAQTGQVSPHPTVPRPVLGVNEKDLLFTVAALYFAVEVAVK